MSKRIFVIVLLLLVAFTVPTAAQELEDLRFFLSYIPNIQFSPFYVAAAKEYFAEAGYNIIFEHGDENVGLEQIAVGDLNFGTISGEQVVLARANDRPVVYVYQWFQQYPVGVLIPSTTEAQTIADLAGHKIGLPGLFGANYVGLTALLAANDMTETDVQLESIGFNAPDIVCAGGVVDAAAIYLNNEPLQIQKRADAGECGDITGITVIPVGESANMVSNGIVTNEQMLTENPDAVRAVVNAFDLGLRTTINNPAEAYLLSIEFVPDLPASEALVATLETLAAAQDEFLAGEPTREEIAESRAAMLDTLKEQIDAAELTQFEVLLATIDLWDAEQLGAGTPEAWETTMATLISMGSIDDGIDLATAYTNEFVPTGE